MYPTTDRFEYIRFKQANKVSSHRVSKHRNCSSHELLQPVTTFIVSIDSFPTQFDT